MSTSFTAAVCSNAHNARPKERRGRSAIRGSLLYLRLKAVDPDRFLDRLGPHVGFFFTRTFLVASAIIFLLAVGITVAGVGRNQPGHQPAVPVFDALLLAWVTIIAVTIAHELAHALTCKRFGGHVHEIGFLLIYFQPAFYCNVSDAWLFPEKRRRLWVMFAGIYLDLIVWALATVLWWLTDTDVLLNFLALVVMATSGIKTLFNLNPLIKLDGFCLLSDALEIPNLRQKSFAYLQAIFRRLIAWPGVVRRRSSSLTEPEARQRRVYLAYGILAAAYSTWLMGLLIVQIGGFLVDRYRGAGFVLFAGLLMATFHTPLGNVFARLGALAHWPAIWGSRWVRWGTFIALAAAVAVVKMDLKVSGEFTVMPGHNADVRAPVAGIIEEVYVNEGDRVDAGARVARLADKDSRVELRQIELQIAAQRARLRLLRAGPTPQAGRALETGAGDRPITPAAS